MPELINFIFTWRIVGCCIWCPLTKVKASACNGVTVQTLSSSDIKQWRACIDGPNNCKALVFADPTYKKIITINNHILSETYN